MTAGPEAARGLRVAVDGVFLGGRRGGDETFLRGLLAGLAAARDDHDHFPLLVADSPDAVEVPVEIENNPGFPLVRIHSRPGLRHFAVDLPRALRRVGHLDLAVSVTHAPLRGRVPSVVVVGDLSFVHRPDDYPVSVAARLRTLVPWHARHAAAVLTPSQFTRADLIRTWGLDPRRVHVVPNRVEPMPRTAVVGRAGVALAARGVAAPYLLYLGNLHRRKNVPQLIRSFRAARATDPALAGHRLVIAGGDWFGGSGESAAAAGDPAVLFLGRVTDDERAALLHGADALAYVSHYEGFGLPPLEAMAVGVPVLASSTTSLPEVCADAALLVDPADPDAITAAVQRVLRDDPLRARLRRVGPVQAGRFDTDRVGRAAITAFRGAADRPSRIREVRREAIAESA